MLQLNGGDIYIYIYERGTSLSKRLNMEANSATLYIHGNFDGATFA